MHSPDEKAADEMIIDGIRIPKAFRPLEISMEELNRVRQELRERLRWFEGEHPFLFDDNDAEFKEFLDRCKQETKLLQKALQAEFDSRGKKILAERKSKPGARKQSQRITFMIRPPFLSSNMAKSGDNRWQQEGREMSFIIHVDESHAVQRVRSWQKPEEQSQQILVSMLIADTLEQPEAKEFLKKNYGNWGAMAKTIADTVIEAMETSALLKETIYGKARPSGEENEKTDR